MESRSKEAKRRRHKNWVKKHPDRLSTAKKRYWQKYKQTYKNRRYTHIVRVKDEHGSRCQLCGYDDNYAALIFHHQDSKNKIKDVAKWGSYESIKKEANGCILICANCHMDLHNKNLRKAEWHKI